MCHDRCPSEKELQAYLVGRLSGNPAERVDQHLEECERCLATLAQCDTETDPIVAKLRDLQPLEDYCREAFCREAVARVKSLEASSDPGFASLAHTSSTPVLMPIRLGEYELLEPLGRGGMGAVYKARHVKLNRIVALKTLVGTRLSNPSAVARFEREMRAVGQLKHPQIVDAYDAREIDGIPFLVMEYVEGVTLARLARQLGPLPVADACDLIRQAAEGLQYVCDQGLVHRDVKPSNLMLAFTGQVKILDLGLARFLANEPAGEEMTGAGCVMGTVDYMAPEQVSDSHRVDIRADIYSLGCTFYRLISGHPPFAGPKYATVREKLIAHTCHPVPPLSDVCPDAPAELQVVLDRMLTKRRDERFSRPNEVAVVFQPFAAGAQLPALIARFRGAVDSREQQETSREAVRTAEIAEVPASSAEAAAPGSKKRKALWWGLVALAGTLVVSGIALSVVLRIRRGNQETIVRVPEPSEVTVYSSGEVEVKLPRSPTTESPVVDWERRVAVWAIQAGGRLQVLTLHDESPREVDRVETLPEGTFLIHVLSLYNTSKVRDQDFQMLSNLRGIKGVSLEQVPITDLGIRHVARVRSLRWLFLSDTRVTAEGLSPLRDLVNLETLGLAGLPITGDSLSRLATSKRLNYLYLNRTSVTDSSLATLTGMSSLTFLDLHDTAITDAGLEELKKVPTLRKLDVSGTKVTPAAIEIFRQAMPNCEVLSGKNRN
jgi:serine/threonine protein kinase